MGATAPASPFVGTPIETNPFARFFVPLDMLLPSIPLRTATGMANLPQLTGKTRLVTLWAEWCVPCLIEARDLAALNQSYAGPTFEIVSILTASNAKLDYAAAAARLDKAGAAGLPLLVEADGGSSVGRSLSPTPGKTSVPCTLLVDRRGRVRGRMLVAPVASTGAMPPGAQRRGPDGQPLPLVLTEAQKQAVFGGSPHSLWSAPPGAAFIGALRDGVLR